MDCVEGESSQLNKNEVTFESLGVIDVLCEACKDLKWKSPSAIQKEAIPVALRGHDIIGLAETGSGKTGAFAIPILQALLKTAQRFFALILTPTRELAFQIAEQFEALGSNIGIKTAVIVGGINMISQSSALSKKPHVIIATPGRLVDHLENTKGFSLRGIKYLVMDEADRILDLNFDQEIEKILKVLPEERHTYLYSATMTEKVQKLQKASLKDPVKIEVSKKYQTVEKLKQYYLFMPLIHKDLYLVHLLSKLPGDSIMVFRASFAKTQQTALLLKKLGFTAIPLHGRLSQARRLLALQKFKAKTRAILITTDVASRGLDIPHVDVVINFDLPSHPKDYIHRVGRTARAGRVGKSFSFVCTKEDVVELQKIEFYIGKKLSVFQTFAEELEPLTEKVKEAQVFAKKEMKDLEVKETKKRKKDNETDEETEKSTTVKKFKKKAEYK